MIRLFLRRGLTGMAGNAIVGMLTAGAQTAAFLSVAGSTPASRAAFAQQMGLLGRQISFMLPLPVRVDDIWGYYYWRGLSGSVLIFAGWAVFAATGATRGEEEKGLTEEWLAAGISRARLVATRLSVFLIAAVVAVTLTQLTAAAGGVRSGAAVPWAAMTLQGVALLALLAACFAISMLSAQFATTRRGAGGVAGGIIAVLFLVNSLSRTLDGLQPYRAISPFYYYDRTDALVPGGHFDAGATAVLVIIAIALSAVTALVFERRDVGATPFQRPPKPAPPVAVPSHAPLLRNSITEAVWERRASIVAWTLATSIMAGFLVSLTQTLTSLVNQNPVFHRYMLAFGSAGADGAFIQALWFSFAQLLGAGFVVFEVARWTADDEEGRLEMLLSTPFPRWRVVAERFVVLSLQLAAVVGISCLVAWLVAVNQGLHFSTGDFILSSVLLVPVMLAFGAVGAVLSGFAPRAAVAVLGVVAMVSYLLQQLGPLVSLPDAVNNLSLFKLYGTPMTTGVYWTGLYTLAAVCVAGFGGGTYLMTRREVGR